MTHPDLVPLLAAFALLFWSAIAVRFFGAIWRGMRHNARENDQLRSFLFFVASLQIAFIVRRLAAPDDAASLAGLYVLSIMCALVGVMVLRGYTHES